MTQYWIPVYGTHGEDDAWATPQGVLAPLFARHGLELYPRRFEGFTGDLDGVPLDRGRDWPAGSYAFEYFVEPIPLLQRRVVAHSHGGAVVLDAAQRIPINTLITVGTPVRKEVREHGRIALERGHIRAWLHIHDAGWDWWQRLGMVFDRQWFGAPAFNLPGMVDHAVPRIGHSKVLHDAAAAKLWITQGWLEVLRGAEELV